MPKDDVIAALEKATADSAELMREAFNALFPAPSETWGDDWQDWFYRRTCFVRMLDARAYESAALLMVPEGWFFDIRIRPQSLIDQHAPFLKMGEVSFTHPDGETGIWRRVQASTPALAICLAALRATERGEAGR